MSTTQRHGVFCRCGHNRSLIAFGLRHICGVANCECVKHDTATKPPKARLSVVETPVPEMIEDDPTAKVGHVTDAQLMAEWRARAAALGVLA